jgi:MYXO-CTERM domain-containing protein
MHGTKTRPQPIRHTQRRLLVAFTFFLTLLVAGSALADRVKWKKTKVEESSGSWRIDLEFYMNRAPDIALVPMRFEFENTVYYERALVDGKEEPINRAVPLVGKQPLVETVDVGFLDPGTGKTQPRTRFSFKLTRDRGFEAGEYLVKVQNKRSGKTIVAHQKLVLEGENDVIDRRSISFDGPKKKKKKDDTEKKAEQEEEKQPDPNSDEYWAGGEPDAPEGDLPPPAHMQDKPGACGCRVPAAGGSSGAALLFLWAMVLAPFLRRRQTPSVPR